MQLLPLSFSGTNAAFRKAAHDFPAKKTEITPSERVFATDSLKMPEATTSPPVTWEKLKTYKHPFLGAIDVYEFSNGQQLYALKRDNIPLASFGVLYHAGSVNEPARIQGISHFLEHLIFDSEQPGQKTLKEQLDMPGAIVNAFTAPDKTFYHSNNVPKELITDAIRVWGKALEGFSITQPVLEREKQTVLNEVSEYKDRPESKLVEKLLSKLWPDNKGMWGSSGVLGTPETLRPIGKKDIDAYYREYYAPHNRKLILVGDFDTKKALEAIAQSFNASRRGDVKPRKNSHFPVNKLSSDFGVLKPNEARIETHYADVETGKLLLAQDLDLRKGLNLEVPADREELLRRELSFALFSFFMTAHRNSRLESRLVEQEKIANGTSGGLNPLLNRYGLVLEAYFMPEHADRVQAALLEEVTRLKAHGITEQELTIAKKAQKFALVKMAEIQGNYFKNLLGGAFSQRPEIFTGKDLAVLDALDVATINRIYKTFIDVNQFVGVRQLPKEAVLANAKNTVAFAKQPTFSGRLKPSQQSLKLNGGGELLVEERPGLPLLGIHLIFNGGNRHIKNNAVASMLSLLMNRGTSQRSPQAFAQDVLESGVHLGGAVSKTMFKLSGSSLHDNQQTFWRIFERFFKEGPPFNNNEELALLKKRQRENYQATLEEVPTVRMDAFHDKHFYPAGHEFAQSAADVINQAQAVSMDDLKQHFKALLRQPSLTVAVIGDVKANEVKKKVEELVSTVSPEPAEKPIYAPRFDLPVTTVHTVSHAGPAPLEQTMIRRSWLGPAPNTDDYAALQILDSILSSGLSSRFHKVFRDTDEGLCYAVGSGIPQNSKTFSRFDFVIKTKPEKAKKVLMRFQEEVQKLLASPPSRDELEPIKKRIQATRHVLNQSTMANTTELATHRAQDEPNFDDDIDKLLAVTPEDVQRVAKKYLTKPSVTTIYAAADAFTAMGLLPNKKMTLPNDDVFLSQRYEAVTAEDNPVQNPEKVVA